MAKIVKREIVVTVGYYEFVFSDLMAANAFAYVAKTHVTDSDKYVGIAVNYDFEEQEEEEQDD